MVDPFVGHGDGPKADEGQQQGQPIVLPAQRRAVSPLAHRDLRDGEGEADARHHLDPDEPRFEVRLRRDEHGLIDDAEAKADAQGAAVDGGV